VRTGVEVHVEFDNIRTVMRWANKPIGIAERTFPNPKTWRLGGADLPLDQLTVRALTKALARRGWVEPSCIAAWAQRIGALPSDIGALGRRPPLRTDGDDGDGKGSRFGAHQHRPEGEAPFSAPQARKILGPKAVFLDF
jgi:hypothetical protein